jgi:hypothetical protein
MSLAESSSMPQVRALASQQLRNLARDIGARATASYEDVAHGTQLADDIKRFLERPYDLGRPAATPSAPPGAPIGDIGLDYLLGLDLCAWRR